MKQSVPSCLWICWESGLQAYLVLPSSTASHGRDETQVNEEVAEGAVVAAVAVEAGPDQ